MALATTRIAAVNLMLPFFNFSKRKFCIAICRHGLGMMHAMERGLE
jgi:hypothetical protein